MVSSILFTTRTGSSEGPLLCPHLNLDSTSWGSFVDLIDTNTFQVPYFNQSIKCLLGNSMPIKNC